MLEVFKEMVCKGEHRKDGGKRGKMTSQGAQKKTAKRTAAATRTKAGSTVDVYAKKGQLLQLGTPLHMIITFHIVLPLHSMRSRQLA